MTHHDEAAALRAKHIDAILACGAKKRLVVAGPGTGKTYLFKKVIAGKKKTLTLTFVNSLVEDLSLELCGLSEVKTLHSFALQILGGKTKVFPKLHTVIQHDAEIMLGVKVDYQSIFQSREDPDNRISFYKARKNYYDRFYGYSDIVFAAVRYLEENKTKIPVFDQIVVDEFQDFNKCEVQLIELLSEKSPVLLAGDDDQALYVFKGASAGHIREKHAAGEHGYESFNLPYCSRSTQVVVDAANDVIAKAISLGHLKGRINKPYQYFPHLEKDKESAQYSKVVHTQTFAIPWFIEREIRRIAEEVRDIFFGLDHLAESEARMVGGKKTKKQRPSPD